MTVIKQGLKNFFAEKELEHLTFAVVHNDQAHMIDSDFLINVIVNHTPSHEQEKISAILARINLHDGNVNHFLEHLAKSYVITNFS